MLIPVILSGGAGTRLWPVSREMHPKPFIQLNDGQSLLQKTLARALLLANTPEILTITNREFYFKTKDEYAAVDSEVKKNYLLEPVGRNTAPAIGMAALYVMEKYGPTATLLILPADHLIANEEAFCLAVEQAYAAAADNKIITFGVKPTHPETAYGYIKTNADINKIAAAEKFVEKPSLVLAEEYVASAQYLWNAGMFCFTAETILSELDQFASDIAQPLRACWNFSKQPSGFSDQIEIDKQTFMQVPDRSIDYAVMEHSQDVLVVTGDFAWTDVGSWQAISELVVPDEEGNRALGETVLIDSVDSFVQGHHRLIATLGINNLMIIDTPDALLVADRRRHQEVKEVVKQLKQRNHAECERHLTTFRPWGSYTILEEHSHVKIKRITVQPGASLSLQLHHHRSEHWVVVSGTAKVTIGTQTLLLQSNESTFVPVGVQHRLENPGTQPLEVIEIQTGDYLSEEDIVRFDDIYGRLA